MVKKKKKQQEQQQKTQKTFFRNENHINEPYHNFYSTTVFLMSWTAL